MRGPWDPYNVAEDADLAFRLAVAGYEIGMLDSVTYEEAPDIARMAKNQRSRWLRGFAQTGPGAYPPSGPADPVRRAAALPGLRAIHAGNGVLFCQKLIARFGSNSSPRQRPLYTDGRPSFPYLPVEKRNATLTAIASTCIEPISPAFAVPDWEQAPIGRFYERFGSHWYSIAWHLDDPLDLYRTLLRHQVRFFGQGGAKDEPTPDDPLFTQPQGHGVHPGVHGPQVLHAPAREMLQTAGSERRMAVSPFLGVGTQIIYSCAYSPT